MLEGTNELVLNDGVGWITETAVETLLVAGCCLTLVGPELHESLK